MTITHTRMGNGYTVEMSPDELREDLLAGHSSAGRRVSA